MRFPAFWSKPRRQARVLGLEALEDRSLLSGTPAPAIDLSGLSVKTSQYSATDILVEFKAAAIGHGAVPALAGTTAGSQLPLVPDLYQINLNPGVTPQQAVAEYSADSQVQFVGLDYSLSDSAVPNNPDFNQQWSLLNTGQGGGTPGDDIGATHAWSVTTGSASTIVAVMDTGIDYDQQDLYGNIWLNQAEIPKSRLAPSLGGTNPNGIQDYYHDGYVSWRDLNDPRNIGPGKITDVNGDGIIDAADILAPMQLNAQGQDTGLGGWAYAGNTQDGDAAHPNDFIGWNFVNNTNNPLDQNGHGTHVAGIIGAMGNSGVGVAGIDWQVSLMPVQFLNANGNGSISAFISGLSYAIQHGAKISNNSWSGATNDPLLSAAVQNARDNGMIFVAAAGNGGNNNDVSPAYPSSFTYDNVVSVAAVDNNNNLASFSNYGAKSVDLAAPGVNILSTLPNNSYGTLSGTSMAAPMVTGVLALVMSEHPSWTYQQVINQVLDTVDPVPGLQGKVLTGGVLDAARAVGYNTPPPTAPTPPATLQIVSSTASGAAAGTFDTISVTFNQAVNASVFNNSDVALVGPNGQRITIQSFQAVSGSGGTQFNFTFSPQSTAGTYTLYIGAGILSVAGVPLTSTYSNTFQLSNAVTFTSTTPVGIPDVSQTTASLTVPQSLTIGRVTVNINMVNSIDGQMMLALIAPDGTAVLLSNQEGGTGVGFTNTVFDDQAATSIGSGQAPFTGSFRPESPLAGLSGKNAQGTWKLLIIDHATNYHVLLTSWSLTFSSASASGQLGTASVPGAALASDLAVALAGGPVSVHPAAGVAGAGFGAQLTSILSTLGNKDTGALSLPGAAQLPANGVTTPSDEFFASEGIDRLAELRVLVAHADRADGADADTDESSDSLDAVDAALLDF